MKQRLLGIFSVALAAVVLAACSEAVVLNSKGEIGQQQVALIYQAFGLMLIAVIPALVLTVLFAWKYRASNKNAKYRPKWSHSTAIEVVVWGIPCLIIAFLAYVTYITSHKLDPYRPIESDKPTLPIQVVSLDWKWMFIYPEQNIATINEIAIPVDRPVRFDITSATAMNAFNIPQLGGMVYAMAGMQTQLHLIANEAGTYFGQSTNYSGAGFSGMRFQTYAVSDAEFDQWVNKVRQSPAVLNDASYDKLMVKSRNNAPEYFGSVQPGLFQQILDTYMGGRMDPDLVEKAKTEGTSQRQHHHQPRQDEPAPAAVEHAADAGEHGAAEQPAAGQGENAAVEGAQHDGQAHGAAVQH
ncbi:cytochrome bo3 quinol oxidase subunit 2 [Kerstersia gyiorum]|uniref:Ubiquinol oxidase subunit 2 n=1 Tax=Kerstersia gyiorum TaxID=206506 RepID=A0A4V2F196_9BURK|nr:ubiquinol oxidase subunit II [Kerstersia gyiorum]QBR39323.1 ubiquinol oxidase subunit II [Kerstersia gyiorum]RZS72917.1 cytochrome bo3 quinol oxidase subunit 2 [Kerstersia gyiorum]